MYILEDAIYSVVSPEGCASILKKDARRAPEVATHLKLTAYDLLEHNLVDEIIEISTDNTKHIINNIKEILIRDINKYKLMKDYDIKLERNNKFRRIGKIEKSYFDL